MKIANRNIKALGKASFAMILALGAFALLPATPVRAQDPTLPTKEVNITLNDAPVRTALDTLFKSAGLNYTIDPLVSGLVTVSLRAVPFDVALRSILRSSDPPLAYTVTDGVYDIHPRQQQIELTGPGLTTSSDQTAQAAAPAPATTDDTTTQIVPLKLNYANAALLLRYALGSMSPGGSGYIPTLNAPQTGGGQGGQGGQSGGGQGGFGGGQSGGQSGGFGGSSGGYGGGQSGGSSGGFGGSSGGFGGGGTTSF